MVLLGAFLLVVKWDDSINVWAVFSFPSIVLFVFRLVMVQLSPFFSPVTLTERAAWGNAAFPSWLFPSRNKLLGVDGAVHISSQF